MTRKIALVALATGLIVTLPALLTAAVDTTTERPAAVVQPAAQQDYPDWMFEPAYPEPDWELLEQCWTGRGSGPSVTPPGCSGRYPITLPCHWTVPYPSRHWVEQACGPIDGWGPDFGFGWYGHWDPHPGRDWVQRLRGGGQP